MRIVTGLALGLALTASAVAQEQQAGNEASANAEETFNKLIEQCDNTDMLFLRAKIRLELGRIDAAAAGTSKQLLDQGMAKCGEGKLDEAKSTLEESYRIAKAATAEKFEAQAEVTGSIAKQPETDTANTAEGKPWWKFW
ncbi:MAG: hypothetical protein AAGF81_17720 [Pseudomonadota bacterium]